MIKLPSIFPVACHTDNVGPGSIFVVIKGQNSNGLQYIRTALAKGAACIVVEKSEIISDDLKELIAQQNVQLMYVENSRKSLGQLSAQAAEYPAQKLKILGVTGTKGKTTSVYILEHLLTSMGKKVARMSTIKNAIDGHELPALLTTSQPDYLHQFFALCVAHHIEYVVMEIAAQATTFNRLETIELDGLIFTNLDREHAELYPDMHDYFTAKAAITHHLKIDAPCIINIDDAYGFKLSKLYQNNIGFSFSSHTQAYIHYQASTVGTLISDNNQSYHYTDIPGIFNAYNLAGCITLLHQLGFNSQDFSKGLLTIPAIPGRLEEVPLPNGARAYIDYAHTPGSFESVLSMVRTLTDHLIVIFGAGGSKDPIKRPLMGEITTRYADLTIITTDNPRQEEPQNIISDILKGIDNQKTIHIEFDREKAIHYAYAHSKPSSIIMLLGKGPDEYQIIGTTKIPFSEKTILKSL